MPLVVLAGDEYGTGSSRDWAAKGTYLLGVRAVIGRRASSGSTAATWSAWACLPLEFPAGRTWQSLGLTGEEIFDFPELDDSFRAGSRPDRPGHDARRYGRRVHRPRADRHAGRAGVLPQRRHSADRAAEAAEGSVARRMGSWLWR